VLANDLTSSTSASLYGVETMKPLYN